MGKSAPPAPDYKGAAQEQAAGSREAVTAQTWANRPTQTTPWGTSSWTTGTQIDPATGQNVTTWNQNLQLTPEQQQALDSQQQLQQQRSDLASSMFDRVGQELGPGMDWDQYGDPTGLQSNADQQRARAEENAMQAFSSRADPRFAREENALRTRLANQGITQNSDPYSRATQDFGATKEDAYRQAQFQAIATGGQEGQRQQGMDVTSADYANKVRQQQISEDMQRRGFSLNEINALLTGQQVGMPGMPQFGQSGAAQGVQSLNAAGQQGQAGLDAFNAGQAQTGQTIGAVGGIAAAAVML